MTEKRIDLKKDVFSKAQYIKTINTSFNELGVTSISEDLQQETSVEEFFELYQQLFYEIPAEGDTNSHRYLVRESGEYINFDEQLEEIQALREEIAQLRTEILGLQVQQIEKDTGQSLGINVDSLTNQFGGLTTSLEANEAAIAASVQNKLAPTTDTAKSQGSSAQVGGFGGNTGGSGGAGGAGGNSGGY